MRAFDGDKIKIDNEDLYPCAERPRSYRAMQINDPNGFRVRVRGISQYGQPGDYMLIDDKGNRSICAKGDFQTKFSFNGPQETIVRAGLLPDKLSDGTVIYITAMYPDGQGEIQERPKITHEDLQNEAIPEHLEITWRKPDGTRSQAIYDLNFETDPIPGSDSVAQLIAEGGFQTHSTSTETDEDTDEDTDEVPFDH